MIVQGVCQDYEFADPIIVTFTEIDRLGIWLM
jgi:hypothetical protein